MTVSVGLWVKYVPFVESSETPDTVLPGTELAGRPWTTAGVNESRVVKAEVWCGCCVGLVGAGGQVRPAGPL